MTDKMAKKELNDALHDFIIAAVNNYLRAEEIAEQVRMLQNEPVKPKSVNDTVQDLVDRIAAFGRAFQFTPEITRRALADVTRELENMRELSVQSRAIQEELDRVRLDTVKILKESNAELFSEVLRMKTALREIEREAGLCENAGASLQFVSWARQTAHAASYKKEDKNA